MNALTIKTAHHRHDPHSTHENHWSAEVSGSSRTGFGEGGTQSEAIKTAVDNYFRVRVVEGLTFDAGCEHR